MHENIVIKGGREHNLKNIDITIPRNKLVVITGLSGSGKSSLAFDTLYAEGQRRYVESLSAYARQFLEIMQKPDVDSIEGLSPAISIEQKTTSKNPRSTVGTVTEIYDYFRLLYARIGIPHSPATGLPIESQVITQMVDRIMQLHPETKLLLLSPLVQGRKGEYKKEIADLIKKGYQRLKVDGTLYEIDAVPALNKKVKHSIEVVVDRLIVKEGIEQRLAQSLENALKLSDGLVFVENLTDNTQLTFSEKYACPVSGFTLNEIEPRLFSFNSPFGACPHCGGLGEKVTFSPDLIIPDSSLSIIDGAIVPWNTSFFSYYLQTLKSVIKYYNDSPSKAFKDLKPETQQAILYGSGRSSISTIIEDGSHTYRNNKPFEGVIPTLERRWQDNDNPRKREELEKYQMSSPCLECQSYRLKPESLCVKIAGLHIGQVTQLSIQDVLKWIIDLKGQLSTQHQKIARKIIEEIRNRLGFLNSVGLKYLTLSRASGTLSGGESQRIRLASQIGSGLTGVIYVLDEPSIGLHQRDNDQLLNTLKHLRDLGNSVIVVEHDADTIRIADHIIDMGPGAGLHGGSVVAEGSLTDIINNPNSLTAAYLTGRQTIPVPLQRREGHHGKSIKLYGAKVNNLKNIDVEFPMGKLIAVSGVSGGGKSSLIIETLYKELVRQLNGSREKSGDHKELKGVELIDKIIEIDQSPIGRTPRSNPATYIGAFTPIREWFAGLPESKARGYSAGRFSFNVKGGRCEACQGDGVLKIEMHFLPDVYITCDQCKGQRYNRETLEVKFKDKSIADILDMTVEEGLELFSSIPSIKDKLKTLSRVGLNYIHIGQQATTLSGGEAQRIKLSKELSRRPTGRTIYILDEPTTGLHFEDIRKLLEVLHSIVDQGNTIIVIEHNLDVIKTADWVIDVGPEGGHEGGTVVAIGTPEEIANNSKSITGKYLKPYLN